MTGQQMLNNMEKKLRENGKLKNVLCFFALLILYKGRACLVKSNETLGVGEGTPFY